MFHLKQLRAIERISGIEFPSEFWAFAEDLAPLFGAVFPLGRIATPSDMAAVRELGLPDSLAPFACESQPGHTEYYCWRMGVGPAVAVFADHSVVADWRTAADFLEWIHNLAAEQMLSGADAGRG